LALRFRQINRGFISSVNLICNVCEDLRDKQDARKKTIRY